MIRWILSFNDAAILGLRLAGSGHGALQELCASIGTLPPLTSPSWTLHSKRISEISSTVAKEACLEASRNLHRRTGKPLDEVVDVVVTVDGTWQKRGRTSMFEIVVVISWLTGQVLAVEVLSNYCATCAMHDDLDEDDFEAWYEDHKDSCDCNYEGYGSCWCQKKLASFCPRSKASFYYTSWGW